MKILQVNTIHERKSTGRTCKELSDFLWKNGHECYTAYGVGQSTDEHSYRIGNDFDYYMHNILSRLTGLQGYYSKRATEKFIKYIKVLKPDIIHLRNLHANYLNLPVFFDFLKSAGIPVILNLHDCWIFTGKCAHYTDNKCYKWKTGCENCLKNVIHQYPQSCFFDRTKKMFRDKKRWLTSLPEVYVVGVSKWVADQSRESFLNKFPISHIYNWIDTSVFHPYKDDSIKDEYNIPRDKKVILGVSAGWTKGSVRYEDFMKLAAKLSDKYILVLVGSKGKKVCFSTNVLHIPFVSDTIKLAQLFACADVYVHLATEDTFGKVIVEAMACGTPVVAYDSTVYPEIIEESDGYIVRKGSIRSVLNSIELACLTEHYFNSDNINKFLMLRNCRKIVEIYKECSEC